MSNLQKLERGFLRADLAAVSGLLAQLGEEDVMARLGLEARREELERTVAELDAAPEETAASAALFFGGRPVAGTQGIESEFAGTALAKFQDIVAKVLAHESGILGQRGLVPNKSAATLHITSIVRGSFGFLLEEVQAPAATRDVSLKMAVEATTRLLDAFSEVDEERFRSAVETIDERVLATARVFFTLMRQSGATLRLVSGTVDRTFGTETVAQAAERATTTSVEESQEILRGQLTGILPESRQFEFRAVEIEEALRGRVDRAIQGDQLEAFNREWLYRNLEATIHVKRVRRSGAIVRETFTLISLDPATE
jgi:hypothetical protein